MVSPEEVDQRRVRRAAAGVPAVTVALRRGIEQMGPTRTMRTLLALNQATGFDCPGCAWPEPEPSQRKRAEFCENGAKAVAEEATTARVTPAFFAEHSIDDLAGWTDYELGRAGRLTHPMVRRPGATHYTPTGWDEAFALVGDHLRALDHPDEAAFYTSGRASNEAAFVVQLLARAFGTNNLPDCSNMCHESTSVALVDTIGIGKGTVSLDDVHQAELLVICGQNPGTNHPRMLSALEVAKRNGATIVAVNPLPEAGLLKFDNPQTPRGLSGIGTRLADQHLAIRLGGDGALFAAIGHLLLQRDDAALAAGQPGPLDHDFIARHTDGYDVYAAHARRLDWPSVLAATGLERGEIEALAGHFARSKATVVCWAMGITQHRGAVATIKAIVNVALLQGNLGKPGAGLCPVRGHSNVQGDRTMGVWEQLPPEFGDALQAEFGFDPPRQRGFDVVNTIGALRDGRLKVLIGLGGNFVGATPDRDVTVAAVRRAELTVQLSTKLNRSHLVTGETALILPVLGRTERDVTSAGAQAVTVEDSMSSVHRSFGVLAPASEHLRSEVQVLCGIAASTLSGNERSANIDWAAMAADYGVIRRHIAHVVPHCEAYDEKVARPGGFVLANPPRDSRSFDTASGRARFSVVGHETMHVTDGHFVLQTLRSHDQYNTTIYGHDDRYRGLSGNRHVVMINRADRESLGIAAGAVVDVVGVWSGDDTRRVASGFTLVDYPTPRGCLAAYYPECNVLVPLDAVAVESNCPTSKSIVVRLEPRALPQKAEAVAGRAT